MNQMAYEELLKIAGNRLEEMEEQMQMLSPDDLGGGQKGREAYRAISVLYEKFGKTGDMTCFERVADRLSMVTGSHL